MASGLSIVIDTRNAELNIKNLNQALERLETQGNSIANMMRNLGGANPFAGLTTSITQLKDGFNDFAGASNTAKTAIKNLADTFTTAKTAIDSAEASLRQFNQTASASGGLGRLNSALTATHNNLNQTNNTIHNTQNNFNQLNNNVNLTRNTFTQLNNTVNNSTTIINNYSRSAINAANSTNNAANSANRANSAFAQLNNTLSRLQTLATGGIMGGMLLSVAKTADAMQGLENQVRLVTQGEEQREEVQRRLLAIANKNYADIEAVTGSYQRNAFALAQLGKSQMDVLNFTDALSLAMRTGGRSMQEQKAAVYQLSQAMGAGKLMGDEFRSLSENAPIILKYIAKEMGVTTGALKELGSEGKITSEIIYNAMMKARPEMEKMAQSLPITMSQAWQQVNNSYKTFVDNFMNGTGGMSQGIASMLQGVAKNFDTIVKGMTIAGGLAFVGFASKIDIATKSMALFNLVANANPFVRMATIILAVSSAFYGLDDVINTTSVIMGDLIRMITDGWTGIFTLIGDGADWLQGKTSQSNDDIGKSYKDMFTNATTDHDKFIANATFASNNLVKTISTDNMKNEQSYLGFYQKSEKGFTGLVQNLVGGVVAITAAFAGFFTWVGSHFADLGRQIANITMDIADFGREVIDAGKRKLGLDVQPRVKEPRYALTNMDARDAFAMLNREGQKWVRDYFTTIGQRTAPVALTGTPQSLYPPITPGAKPPSSNDYNGGKKKEARDLLQGEIADAIQWAAAHLKINPNDLAAVISFETGGTFSTGKKNPGSSATGLIQFMEYADNKRDGKYYGYTRNQFAALSPNEQMKYVVEYLKGRGIGQGSGVGDIYDAVAGYGYRKGTKAYEQNRVWDANRDGYVAKGEAVTAKAFQPHIKNYFPNGINLQDAGKVETELAKNQAALDKARSDYLASILTGEAKLQAELDKQIADLPNKGFSGQALEDEEARLRKEYDFDLDLFKETNKRKLEELSGLQKTKRQMILDDAYFEGLQIAADESKSEAQRKAEIEAIDKRTKAQIGALDLEQAKKMADLNAYHTSAMQLILDRSNFAKAEIAANNEDLQTKLAQIAATEYEQRTAIFGLFDNQPKNLDRPMFFGKGAEGQYQEAMYNAAEILRIYDKNYADLEARGLLHSQTMIDFQTIYAEKVRQSNEAILEAERNVMSERLSIWSQGLDLVGGVWGQMTDIITNAYGKQSAAARAFFFIQKTIAAAQAIVNTEEGATKALAQGGALFGVPMATIVRASGYASAGIIMGQGIAGAFGKGFATGGYTGNMGVNDIAGVVHGKEYVLNAAATRKIGVDNLNRMNRGEGIGSNVNVIIENHTGAPVQQRTDSEGNVRVIVGQEIKRQVNDPNSDLNNGIKRNYKMQRNLNV